MYLPPELWSIILAFKHQNFLAVFPSAVDLVHDTRFRGMAYRPVSWEWTKLKGIMLHDLFATPERTWHRKYMCIPAWRCLSKKEKQQHYIAARAQYFQLCKLISAALRILYFDDMSRYLVTHVQLPSGIRLVFPYNQDTETLCSKCCQFLP